MRSDFKAKEFMSLSLTEQARLSRLEAHRAIGLARLATNENQKAAYADIANQWLSLANEMERGSRESAEGEQTAIRAEQGAKRRKQR